MTEDPQKPFRVLMVLPARGDGEISRESAARLIAQHLPAHVQYELRFVKRRNVQGAGGIWLSTIEIGDIQTLSG